MKVGRNAPCPCGSGKKLKRCCAAKKARREGLWARGVGVVAVAFLILILILVGLFVLVGGGSDRATESQSSRRVWSEAHGHWHTVP